MTITQAQMRINELKPKADAAYERLSVVEKERSRLMDEWHPLYTEIQKLENFIKMAEGLHEQGA